MTQRLKGAGLIGTKRAAALQDQYALRVRGRRRRRGIGGVHDVHRAAIKANYTVASVHDGVNQAGGPEGSLRVYRGSDDARMSVQNTLYLVFGA